MSVTTDTTRNLDLTPMRVAGTVTYEGATIPDDTSSSADYYVSWSEIETGVTLREGFGRTEPYTLVIPAGIYDVSIDLDNDDESVLQTPFSLGECIEIAPD